MAPALEPVNGVVGAFPRRADGTLCVEAVPLPDIAAVAGTPAYVYSATTLEARYDAFAAAFRESALEALICFAVKANDAAAVLRTLFRRGAGADVVSEGELRRALAAGAPPQRIVFSGVGKSAPEMALALRAGILQFNVESAEELMLLNRVAGEVGRMASVALRVNPDVDAKTHDKIATGRRGDKFGVALADAPALYARTAAAPHLRPVSISVHIGSQIADLTPFRTAFARIAALATTLRGQGILLERLDLGGGLGVAYTATDPTPPTAAAYADVVAETVGALRLPVVLEPGRALTALAGVLLTRVLYEKREDGRRFVVVDAAMNDLLRPALYGGVHLPHPVVAPPPDAVWSVADVVGPVCESGDVLARGQLLPPLASGDLLALAMAGAYGAAMASTYNSRLLAAEVLASGDRFAVIRPRQTWDELLSRDRPAPWLVEGGEV